MKHLISEESLRLVRPLREEEKRHSDCDIQNPRANSNSVDYHSDTEAGKMLDEMQFFREKKYFCDITIVVGDKELEV